MIGRITGALAMAFASLASVGCDRGVVAEEEADRAAASAIPSESATAIGGMAQIDPDPLPADSAQILSRETIEVGGKPACAIIVRYPGHIDQEATWTGEPCDAPEIAIIEAARLRDAGQLDDLDEEARIDIERMTDGVLVVESRFSASAFPLNVAGRIYEVPYAD